MKLKFYSIIIVIAMLLSMAVIQADKVIINRYQTTLNTQVSEQLKHIENRLTFNLYNNIHVIKGIPAILTIKPSLSQAEFALLASKIMGTQTQLRHIALAPNLVIKYIYPLKGNEAALNVDFRTLPKQIKPVLQAKKSHQSVLSGPIELIQGGTAFISRVPIFISHDNDTESFWGIVSAVIDANRFYKKSGLFDTDLPIDIAIKGKDNVVFFGTPELFNPDNIYSTITVPNGIWQLVAQPKGGWPPLPENITKTRLLLVGVALLLLLMLYTFLRATMNASIANLKFKNLIEDSPAPYALTHNKQLIFLNDAFTNTYGYVLKDLLTSTIWWHTMCPDPVYKKHVTALWNTYTKQVQSSDKLITPLELNIQCKDGSTRIALISLSTNKKLNNTEFPVLLYDITERKHNEQALISSRSQLRSLINTIPDLVWLKDKEGTYLTCNPSFEKFYGVKNIDIIGKTDYDFIDKIQADFLQKHDNKVMLTNKPSVNEAPLVFANNSDQVLFETIKTPIFNHDDKLIGILSIARDITQRKKSEQREKMRSTIFTLLTEDVSLSIILETIIKLIEQENKSLLCSILLLDAKGKHLITGAAPSFPDFYNEAINGLEIADGAGSCGTAAFRGQRVIVENIQTHPYWLSYKELATKANLAACWSEPVFSSNQVLLATFAIYQRHPIKPKTSDIEFIEFMAQLISIVIERHRMMEKIKLSSRVFTDTHEGIIITNTNKEIVDINPAFSNITGFSREEVIGKNPNIFSSGKQSPAFYEVMWQEIDTRGYWKGEIWNLKKNGELYAELLAISAVLDDTGKVVNYVALFTDITQNKQQQEKLSLMAHYDTLTGLPNRALFTDRFHQSIAHSKRSSHQLAVCFLDLDNFKPVNDNYGHDIGDKLLIEVANRITASIREEDTVSRQGGDEFALLLNNIESYSQCKNTLERILQGLAQPCLIDNIPHKITASIGVTLYPDDHEDFDMLIRHADNAMYQAKQSGKHRYHFFDSNHDKQLIEKHHKLAKIQQALTNNEFTLYYQPKVNMQTGDIFGVEALIRWIHPDKGIIPPLSFLPLIDGTDLELQIGNWVINEALQQMNTWLVQGIKIEISVNIASHHLQSRSFTTNLETILAKYPLVNSQYLQLEILESSALSDLETISSIIQICQETLGVSIALDDFGTGYSSLTHLRNLSANIIKIDQSFVKDMLDDPNDYAIIDSVIALSNSFNRDVIAEGIETTEHGLMLLMMGCKEGQGYEIAKPMPANDFPKWLTAYTPNQAWITYANQIKTNKENQIKLLRLTIEQWKNYFTAKVLSSPEDNQQWPIMSDKHCHCGMWIQRAKKESLFNEPSLNNLQIAHDNMYFIAKKIQLNYQAGNIDKARDSLEEVISAYNQITLLNFD